ncbi:MAG: MaoC family dehydratase N-terminal domain-containing protein [Synergistaceae bacterium]|nr:MaoC family dehydratase N-terminal domain-containing protein [Synergistaceae bacterium]
MPEYKYFEDFEIGEKHLSSGRTMTDADIRLFIGCSDNTHPLHVDAEYCKNFPAVGRPVVQGVLTLGVADGFMAKEVLPTKVSMIHYGHEKVRYVKPVYPGDTVHCEFQVAEKVVKNDEFGIVRWDVTVKNQKDEVVLFYVDKQYISRKPRDTEPQRRP